MSRHKATRFELPSGHPCTRFDGGSRAVVVLGGGPDFSHQPMPTWLASMAVPGLDRWLESCTVSFVGRPSGLKVGTSLETMARAHRPVLALLGEGGPVDLVGVSSGGAYAQVIAAEFPELVRSLSLVESANTLSSRGRDIHRRMGEAMAQGDPRGAMAYVVGEVQRRHPLKRLFQVAAWFMAPWMLGGPLDIEGGQAELEAEERFDFGPRLGEIAVPTIVVGGSEDPFYERERFEATAAGIRGARLEIFEGVGHAIPEQREFAEMLLGFWESVGKGRAAA